MLLTTKQNTALLFNIKMIAFNLLQHSNLY